MECIARATQAGWKVDGQLERGENGTPHYQLMVKTPQVRFAAVKRMFPRGHIEVARDSVALARYVQKQESRLAPLSTDSKYYPNLSAYYRLVVKHFLNHNWLNADPACWCGDNPERWWKDAPIRNYSQQSDLYESGVYVERFNEIDMRCWELATASLIMQGYHVEQYWLNPQVKGAIKRFSWEIIARTYAESARQSVNEQVRQESEVSVPTIEYNHAPSAEVSQAPSSRHPPSSSLSDSSDA